MAEGGSWRDGWIELCKGVRNMPRVLRTLHHPFPTLGAFARHVWKVGHDDQRASWFAHYAVSSGVSAFFGGVFVLVGFRHHADDLGRAFRYGYAVGAFLSECFYLYREAGDTRFHEEEEKDWDKPDKDEDWQGRKEEGVTPRYDRVGDLTGPTFNFITSLWGLAP